MNERAELLASIEPKKTKLNHILEQRTSLFSRIGQGQIKEGQDPQTDKKIIRVRSKVENSVSRLTSELEDLKLAEDHLKQLEIRRIQLERYQALYQELEQKPSQDQDLKRALDLLTKKEPSKVEAPLVQPPVSKGSKRINDRMYTFLDLLQTSTKDNPVKFTQVLETVFPGENPFIAKKRLFNLVYRLRKSHQIEIENSTTDKGLEGYYLTEETSIKTSAPQEPSVKVEDIEIRTKTGQKLEGKTVQIIELIKQGSKQEPVTIDQLIAVMFPGVNPKKAKQDLRTHTLYHLRQVLKGTGIELKHEGGYFFQTTTIAESPAIEPKPQPPKQKEALIDYQFESGKKQIKSQEAQILDKLQPYLPPHIVSFEQLAQNHPNNAEFLAVIRAVRGLLYSEKLRLSHISHPKDPQKRGYFIESIRQSKLVLNLLGDTLRFKDKQTKLSDEDLSLLWILNQEPILAEDLSERAFKNPNPEESMLDQAMIDLSKNLTQFTGEKDLITKVGDEKFGIFYKLSDAQIIRNPQALPVHQSRLNALSAFLTDPSIGYEDLKDILGPTRTKTSSYPITRPQSSLALTKAIIRLQKRATENILNDQEVPVVLQMIDFIQKNNLSDEKSLAKMVARSIKQENENIILPSEIEENEGEEEDPESPEINVRPIEVPEYGPLSKADVAIVAANLNLYEKELNAFFKQKKKEPIDKTTLLNLIGLVGNEPAIELKDMTADQMTEYLNIYRIKSFEKIKSLITSPDFSQVCDQIFEKNPDVWELVVNLSELSEGISFIQEVISKPLQADFVIDSQSGAITSIKLDKEEPTKTALEKRDENIRTKLEVVLKDVIEREKITKPLSPGIITNHYPSLKGTKMDELIRKKLVPYTMEGAHYRLDARGVTTMIYLLREGQNLPSRLKKQVQYIVGEVYQQKFEKTD